jgi:hypothetical protein
MPLLEKPRLATFPPPWQPRLGHWLSATASRPYSETLFYSPSSASSLYTWLLHSPCFSSRVRLGFSFLPQSSTDHFLFRSSLEYLVVRGSRSTPRYRSAPPDRRFGRKEQCLVILDGSQPREGILLTLSSPFAVLMRSVEHSSSRCCPYMSYPFVDSFPWTVH